MSGVKKVLRLIELLLYVHGKQLISCRDGQLLNHTVPKQASWRQFTSMQCPFLLFMNQLKRENFSTKKCTGRDGRIQGHLHTKRTLYRPNYSTRLNELRIYWHTATSGHKVHKCALAIKGHSYEAQFEKRYGVLQFQVFLSSFKAA